jgi:hypothetical protein
MRSWLARIILVSLVAGGVVAVFFFPIHPLTSQSTAQSGPTQLYLDMPAGPVIPGQGWPVPPNCSYWHELYPNYCKEWHQVAYFDSMPHNGLLDACDNILLYNLGSGAQKEFHIDAVVPTYYLTCYSPGQPPTPIVAEPVQTVPGPSPICEIWHEINPNFCRTFHIDSWQDSNGNGILDECDFVDSNDPLVGHVDYHIDRIGCDIIVTEKIPTAAKQRSWGWLKKLFR